jgi:hypothetical protein
LIQLLTVNKDYDLNIHYHPSKANVIADALSRKHYCNNLMVHEEQPTLYEELESLRLEIVKEGQLNELSYGPPWAHYLGGYRD